MDYDGPGEIRWLANQALSVDGPVQVQATALEVGWRVNLLAPSFEQWWFLLAFDSPFALVFPDGSAFDVGVGRPDPDGYFEAWDWRTDDQRTDPCPHCGEGGWQVAVNDNGDQSILIVDRCVGCKSERRQDYRWLPTSQAPPADR